MIIESVGNDSFPHFMATAAKIRDRNSQLCVKVAQKAKASTNSLLPSGGGTRFRDSTSGNGVRAAASHGGRRRNAKYTQMPG
jgi:hypothetical protein